MVRRMYEPWHQFIVFRLMGTANKQFSWRRENFMISQLVPSLCNIQPTSLEFWFFFSFKNVISRSWSIQAQFVRYKTTAKPKIVQNCLRKMRGVVSTNTVVDHKIIPQSRVIFKCYQYNTLNEDVYILRSLLTTSICREQTTNILDNLTSVRPSCRE